MFSYFVRSNSASSDKNNLVPKSVIIDSSLTTLLDANRLSLSTEKLPLTK